MKNKIIVLVPTVAVGGAEIMACNQAAQLSAEYEVQLIIVDRIIDRRPIEEFHLAESGVSIIELKVDFAEINAKALLNLFALRSSLVRIINKFSPDVVIAHLPPAHVAARFAKLSFLKKFQLIQYHHGLEFEESPLDTFAKRAFMFLNNKVSRIVGEHDLFISKAVQRNYEGTFTSSLSATIIYNSVPDEAVTAAAAEASLLQSGFGASGYFLVVPGRIQKVKGQMDFLPVFKRLTDQMPAVDLKLIFAGGGPLEKQLLSEINRLQLTEKAIITGFLARHTLLSFMKYANLVVIPSLVEGLGNVAIEGLMLGKTILASNAGGLPEVVQDGHNGYTYKARDAEDCFLQLKRAIEDSLAGSAPDSERIRLSYRRSFAPAKHIHELKQYIQYLLS